jgi:cytochrome P450
MLAASGEHALSDAEVMDLALTVLGGSTDNTNTQMCLNLLALHENPDAWRALRSDRNLVPGAVVEGARWKPGFLAGFRIADEPLEADGLEIEPGAMLFLNVLAGNRDPVVYDDPDRFDITRKAPAGLNFGHGRHFCAGRPVAIVEMEESLHAALDRWSEFSVGETQIVGSPFSLRVDCLEVHVELDATPRP